MGKELKAKEKKSFYEIRITEKIKGILKKKTIKHKNNISSEESDWIVVKLVHRK